MSGGSPLREVLVRIRTASPGTRLGDIARDVGLTRDEVNAMVEYWVRRGELVIDELGSCSSGDCGGCLLRGRGGGCYRPAPRSGPVLLAVRGAGSAPHRAPARAPRDGTAASGATRPWRR